MPRAKKKEFEKNSGKLKFTQGSIGLSGKIFDSKSGNPDTSLLYCCIINLVFSALLKKK